jgi:hypothetical protein
MLRISYPEDPKTADTQLNTDDYTIPLNIYDRLVEAVTTGPRPIGAGPRPGDELGCLE